MQEIGCELHIWVGSKHSKGWFKHTHIVDLGHMAQVFMPGV